MVCCSIFHTCSISKGDRIYSHLDVSVCVTLKTYSQYQIVVLCCISTEYTPKRYPLAIYHISKFLGKVFFSSYFQCFIILLFKLPPFFSVRSSRFNEQRLCRQFFLTLVTYLLPASIEFLRMAAQPFSFIRRKHSILYTDSYQNKTILTRNIRSLASLMC